MQKDEIAVVIDQVAALVREHYVFPEVGEAVAERLIAARLGWTAGTTSWWSRRRWPNG